MHATRRSPAATVACVLAVAGLALAAPAEAAPARPAAWRLAGVDHTSVTVAVRPVHGATSYRVVVSPSRAHLTVAYLRAHHLRSDHTGTARGARVPVRGLPYAVTPYYYRVGVTLAHHPHHVAWAAAASAPFGLRPAAPTGLRWVPGPAGHYLTWRHPASTGALVQATEAGTGRRLSWVLHATDGRFTPYGLTPGHAYDFRVRARTVWTPSAPSNLARVQGARQSALRVMSYNLLGAHLVSGTDPTGRTARYAGWRERVGTAAALVAGYRPDVLSVQEGNTILGSSGATHAGNHAYPSAAWPGEWPIPATSCNHFYSGEDPVYGGGSHYWPYRQVDSLCDTLDARGAAYARAVDGTARHNGSGNYLLYDATTMSQPTAADLGVPAAACWGSDDPSDTVPRDALPAQVRCGGYVTLDDDATDPARRTAAWAVLQQRGTGERLLVLSPHLSAELGPGWSARRATQVHNLLAFAQAKSAQLHVGPVVLAGDYNTYLGRPGVDDTTTPAMRARGYSDAVDTAQHTFNTSYLSGNFYASPPQRTPDRAPGHACLDHLYVAPGVAVRSFGEALHLDARGRFVGAIPSDHNPVWADLLLSAVTSSAV